MKKALMAIMGVCVISGCTVVYKEKAEEISPPPIPVNITVNLQLEDKTDSSVLSLLHEKPDKTSPPITKTVVKYINKPVCKELRELYTLAPLKLDTVKVETEQDRLSYLALLVSHVNLVENIVSEANENDVCAEQIRR